jgi:hypothetical protein
MLGDEHAINSLTLEANDSPRDSRTSLLSLPVELIADIAMMAGFFGTMNLRQTCKSLNHLLSSKYAWSGYTKSTTRSGIARSADDLETKVTICTHLHSFDHLVFGIWEKEGADRLNPTLYFQHVNFEERFDYLGGVTFNLSKTCKLETDFVDSRETLPCYISMIQQEVATGQLPPQLNDDPTSQLSDFQGQVGTGGRRIPHSCEECADHDLKQPLKDIFIYNEIAHNPMWKVDGFKWVHEFPDGRQLTIHIVQDNSSNITMKEELPVVDEAVLSVSGKKLRYSEKQLYFGLVSK